MSDRSAPVVTSMAAGEAVTVFEDRGDAERGWTAPADRFRVTRPNPDP